MKEKMHIVGAMWREADATALDERIRAIEEWLEHTEDLVAMFGNNGEATQELRSTAGIVKKVRNDLSERAETIRADLIERNGSSA